MKTLLVLSFVLMILHRQSIAQGVPLSFANPGQKKTLVLEMNHATVQIEGTDGPDVRIEADGKPVTGSGLAAASLSATQSRNRLTLTKTDDRARTYKLLVPRDVSLSYNDQSLENGSVSIRNIGGEVKVTTLLARISLFDLAGPIYAASQSEDITADFSGQAPGGKVELLSPGRLVEIVAPADFSAAFRVQANTGEVQSDFALGGQVSPAQLRGNGTVQQLAFHLNKGTTPVTVTAHSLSIRKKGA